MHEQKEKEAGDKEMRSEEGRGSIKVRGKEQGIVDMSTAGQCLC